ncbi:hypothetical protein MMC07_008625 [Pseudocyphellaria aurata]|nr:hypothetical protein [Pseudocyphellaria aurata]
MQSKHILVAFFFAACSVAQSNNSAADASTTALPELNSQQLSRLSENYGAYLATQSTQSEFVAVNEYLSSISPESQSEVVREDNSFINQLRTTQSAKLPAYVTALPSSLQDYASSFLEGAERVIDAAVMTSSPSSIGTQTSGTSVVTETQSSITSSASGSSITGASTLATQSSSQNTATTAGTSPSSSSPNAATQPTGALKVVGALAVGMIGLAVVA